MPTRPLARAPAEVYMDGVALLPGICTLQISERARAAWSLITHRYDPADTSAGRWPVDRNVASENSTACRISSNGNCPLWPDRAFSSRNICPPDISPAVAN